MHKCIDEMCVILCMGEVVVGLVIELEGVDASVMTKPNNFYSSIIL